jgi:hypothetical protein
MRVLSDISEVDSLSTLLKKQETVELFEQDGGWLMDSAKNSLTVGSELSHETDNRPGGLRVKTRRGFIQEEQESWLSDEFNTDSKTLALFDVKTLTRNTDDSLRVVFHFEKLDNGLDIFVLLRERSFAWLADTSGESKSLADGGLSQMEILLLDITGSALE